MRRKNNSVLGTSRTLVAATLALSAGGLVSSAHAQWTVIRLHPAGALNSEARTVFGGQQGGVANNAAVALLWNGSAAATRLNPIVDAPAVVNGVAGGVQAGTVTINNLSPAASSHASMWNGTSGSWLDLHPNNPDVIHTNILGMDANTQVGSYAVDGGGTFTAGRACMWNGTAGSWVDLNPPGYSTSEARGVFGNQQVGAQFDAGLGQACLWYGTAESFVNLNAPEALFSAAQCTDGVHQYGVIGVLEPVMGLFPCRWSGTAESWENLGIPADRWGEVHANHDGFQVGYITDTDGISNERASMWSDAPGTYFDLHQFVPADYSGSNALGIWRHADSGTKYIAGYGVNAVSGQREALMWVNGTGVNLITSPSAAVDCSAVVGASISYSVRVLNAGTDASGPVTLTVNLPSGSVATYASAIPAPNIITSSQLTFNLGSIGATGDFTDISITLNAVGAGTTATITASAAATAEVDPTNNTASASSRIEPAPPATAAARGVLSTNAALSNSLMPGGSGARYIAFNQPFASPSGNFWAVRAKNNLPAAQDFAIVRTATGGASIVAAQEGVTVMSGGLIQALDAGTEVNDSGLVVFAGDDVGPTATDRFIATTNGVTIATTAREGQAIPSMAGITYGSSVGSSANIFANGQTGFSTTSTPAGSNAYLSDNGGTILARLNVTIPSGASVPIDTLLINTSGQWGLAFDATGAHSIYQADINTGSAADDQVIVADGTVVLQEGITILSGMTSPVGGGSKFVSMGPAGTWLVRGTNTITTEDWLIRGSNSTIDQVFKVGDPIFTGSTENWQKDAVAATTFIAHTADAGGNYVIGGYSNQADDFTDFVLVYNNRAVVARENDPVDLDGNGTFDDGVYIRSVDADSVALVTGGLVATITLRDTDAALCHLNNASVGQAIVFIPICTADFNGDGTVDFFDYLDFVDAFSSNAPAADFNSDGTIDFFDYLDFVDAFSTGCS